MPEYKADLYADWIEAMRTSLVIRGYSVDQSDGGLAVAIKFMNLEFRNIADQPRTVHRATSLAIPTEFQSVVDEIERKATTGESLTPHLSKLLLRADYNDPLLNDWGIHHLHLSTTLESNGFTSRTGPLLFARVESDAIYLIAILNHGGWTDETLLETILANWPSLLDRFRIKGVTLARSISSTDRARLRKANVNMMTQLSDGFVYAPVGGGVSTAGSNANITIQHDYRARLLRNAEDALPSYIDAWKSSVVSLGRAVPDEPWFRLGGIENGEIIIIEPTSRVGFSMKIGPSS